MVFFHFFIIDEKRPGWFPQMKIFLEIFLRHPVHIFFTEHHAGRVVIIRTYMEDRACDLAAWIIENRSTVRAAAGHFGISKSTVHKDITQRLPEFNAGLYREVKAILELNKAERHLRGGEATRLKYKGE